MSQIEGIGKTIIIRPSSQVPAAIIETPVISPEIEGKANGIVEIIQQMALLLGAPSTDLKEILTYLKSVNSGSARASRFQGLSNLPRPVTSLIPSPSETAKNYVTVRGDKYLCLTPEEYKTSVDSGIIYRENDYRQNDPFLKRFKDDNPRLVCSSYKSKISIGDINSAKSISFGLGTDANKYFTINR